MASSFPVHFCSAALHGASGYTHQDAAPLRVLSRLLSSKYLHVEIREKGTNAFAYNFHTVCMYVIVTHHSVGNAVILPEHFWKNFRETKVFPLYH